mmetsp:Transcript_40391/g.52018  ORF Transcript_40391/g.52018 Transcript_40391/m.52018 type:complete len:1231 (+) Transcript_40391:347-4039(+)
MMNQYNKLQDNNDLDAINESDAQSRASIRQLFQYKDGVDMLLMIVGGIHSMAAGLGVPATLIVIGDMMDELGGGTDSFVQKVNELCVMLIYLGIAVCYCVFMSTVCWTFVGNRQALKIKERYIKSVLRQDIAWFDKNKVTELPTRIISSTTQIQEGIGRQVGDGLQFFTQCVGGCIVGFFFSWKISLVIMAGFPVIVAAAAYLQDVIKQKSVSDDKHYALAGSIATEALSAVRTVFSLNGQKHEVKRYQKHLLSAETAGAFASLRLGIGNGVLFATLYSLYALGYWYGAKSRADQIDNGCVEDNSCISGGDVITVFFSILMGLMSLGQAGPSFQAMGQAMDAGGRIFGTIEREPEIDAMSDKGRKLSTVHGEIHARNVDFCYPTRKDNPVYKGLSLQVKPGENVALVGPSGEGKSTLVSLILRFYDPQGGELLLDGVNIRDLHVSWYRSQIGYVGQEPVLFAGSISQNIRHGRPDATDKDIEAVAQAANAHEFISSFPKGYDTDVGESGTQISGGQKQRIAIARALIKQPKILLLDEATSALDNESERVVQQALDKIQKGSQFTTIVIAHRLSTIQNCDKIAVISNGVVAELGTHAELMSKPDGIYFGFTATKDKTGIEEEKAEQEAIDISEPLQNLSTTGDIESGHKNEGQVSMKRLLGLSSEKWPFMVLGCAGCAVVGGALPTQGILLAKAQDMFYQTDTDRLREEGSTWAIGFLIFATVVLVGNVVRMYGLGMFAENLTMKIRHQCFQKMLKHSVPWFDREENASGVLVERLAVDAAKIHVLAGGVLGSTFNNLFALLVGLGLSFGYSWQMALGVLGTVPFMALGSVVRGTQMGTEIKEASDQNTEAGAISAAVQGIRTVHAFGMQHSVIQTYEEALAKEENSSKKMTFIEGAVFGYGQSVAMLVYAWVFWLGAFLIKKGEISFEEMMTSLFTLITVAFAMGDSAAIAGDQLAGKIAAEDVFALLDSDEELEVSGGSKPSEMQGGLEFKDIHFAYPQRPSVLVYKDFNLSVPVGKTVALCGPSGGGKSTVMGLLLRFYTPLRGSITLDGKDIRDLDIQWLRSQIGYVSQEPVLFSGSIRSNICYGRKDIEENAMIDAARIAKAHDFVSAFQDQYDTDVGEKSMLLSGGQKQRLAIARAILRNPKILLLDEATSALDYENEKEVQEALDNMQAQRRKGALLTTLIIAHRLSTIKNADCIAVLEAGKVIETGNHEQLATTTTNDDSLRA